MHATTTLLAAVLFAAPPDPGNASSPQRSDRAAAPASQTAPQTGTVAVAPPAQGGPVTLETPADARRLCRAVTPPDRLRHAGSTLERADAARQHESERDAALQGRYVVVVPGRDVRFAPYDSDEERLSMWGHAVPVGAGGGARLALVEDEGLPVAADPQAARRIVEAQQQGNLALRVTFVLAEDEEVPCFGLEGASASTFAAEPVAWEYVAGDRVLARGGQGADRPVVSATEGAQPRVEVGRPVDDAGNSDVRTTAQEHVRALETCYADALKRDPYLDGAIVAALGDRGAGGVRIAADSVQDEALTGCVRSVLARVDARGSGRTWLPIHFVLAAPGDKSAQVQQ